MIGQGNVNLVHRFFDAVNRHDIDVILACVDRSVEWVFNGQSFRGHDDYRRMLEEWFRAFPDYKNEITNIIAGDDQIAVEYIGRGTHNGELSLPTGQISPTGRQIELRLCDVYRIRNLKFVVGHNYYDMLTLMRQLGQMPMGRQAGA